MPKIIMNAERLRALAKQPQTSWHAVAQVSGVSYPTVHDAVHGNRMPNWDTLLSLAVGLGLSEQEFLNLTVGDLVQIVGDVDGNHAAEV